MKELNQDQLDFVTAQMNRTSESMEVENKLSRSELKEAWAYYFLLKDKLRDPE